MPSSAPVRNHGDQIFGVDLCKVGKELGYKELFIFFPFPDLGCSRTCPAVDFPFSKQETEIDPGRHQGDPDVPTAPGKSSGKSAPYQTQVSVFFSMSTHLPVIY